MWQNARFGAAGYQQKRLQKAGPDANPSIGITNTRQKDVRGL
jgi:hypothetical protein